MKQSILVIAGSDSIAGAGAQIDIKVAAALGVHATCALTAVTAQSTMSVDAIQLVEPEVVRAQIRAVFSDLPPAAIKIGMLGGDSIARAVAAELAEHPEVPVVLDPVLVATSGGSLSTDLVLDTLEDVLIPMSCVVTPNIAEAETLAGMERIGTPEESREAAEAILALGARNVLIKGGHDEGDECIDRLYCADGEGGARELLELRSARCEGEYHGTGCSLSTAIACGLAQGLSLEEAVTRAHDLVARMIASPTGLGHGSRIISPFTEGGVSKG